jgi:predicted transcriptional regulator
MKPTTILLNSLLRVALTWLWRVICAIFSAVSCNSRTCDLFHPKIFWRRYEMTALTVRLTDEKHRRLKALAKTRGTPLNRLIDEVATLMLAEYDAETRFRLRAERGVGNVDAGLSLLVKAEGKTE